MKRADWWRAAAVISAYIMIMARCITSSEGEAAVTAAATLR